MTEVVSAGETKEDELSREQFEAFLNSVGNHEAKLLTASVIASYPGVWFSQTRIYKEMVSRQGDAPSWEMNRSVPFAYCRHSLEPIGAVVRGEVKGHRGPMLAYQATEFGTGSGMALAGALLSWGLEYPDTFLQRVLGITSSKTDIRSPVTRYRIFEEILTSPYGETSYADIARTLKTDGYAYKTVERQLDEMNEARIVSTASVLQKYNPILEITDSSYRHPSIKFDKATIETRVAYQVMADLMKGGIKNLSLEDFIEMCLSIDPTVDLKEIRHKLVDAGHETSALPGLKVIDRNGAPVKRTSVSIAPEFEKPITDLMNILIEARQGSSSQKFSRMAKAIVSEPQAFNALIDKARKGSPSYRGHLLGPEVYRKNVLELIEALGSVSLKDIRMALEASGMHISTITLRRTLSSLEEEDQIMATESTNTPSKFKTHRRYSAREHS